MVAYHAERHWYNLNAWTMLSRREDVEEARVARLWEQATRMTKGREERMTMAEFTSIPPRFWRDDPDPEARAFFLGPGLNRRSKQFAVAHGIAVEDLPPGGPKL